VTPGLQCSPASCVACAAMRPATRIFSMVSASCVIGPSQVAARLRPTYSGRAIAVGTSRQGEILPGRNSVRTVMSKTLARLEDGHAVDAAGVAGGAIFRCLL